MAFPTYDLVLRVGGALGTELPKSGLTPPEIILLQKLHGDDAVKFLKSAGNTDRSDQDERERLERIYGVERIVQVFGENEYARLPRKVPDAARLLAAAGSGAIDLEALRAEIRAELAAQMAPVPSSETLPPEPMVFKSYKAAQVEPFGFEDDDESEPKAPAGADDIDAVLEKA